MDLAYLNLNKVNFLEFRTKCFISKKQGSRVALLNLYVVTDLQSQVNFAVALTEDFECMILNEDDLKFVIIKGSDYGIYNKVIGGFMVDNARDYISSRDPFYIIEEILKEESFHNNDLVQKIYKDLYLGSL